MKQKDIFLNSEANAWFERNHNAIESRDFSHDPIVNAMDDISKSTNYGLLEGGSVLEIGCGEARRLEVISKKYKLEVFGIEPSEKAVELARKRGVNAVQGTADRLPFEANYFDIVIFGFCLYLCDRNELFQIAYEADRVLKNNAWLIIRDFYSECPSQNKYHHKEHVYSFKMDYRKLFDWHPYYTCLQHKVSKHGSDLLVDDPQEWVATSILRKFQTIS